MRRHYEQPTWNQDGFKMVNTISDMHSSMRARYKRCTTKKFCVDLTKAIHQITTHKNSPVVTRYPYSERISRNLNSDIEKLKELRESIESHNSFTLRQWISFYL